MSRVRALQGRRAEGPVSIDADTVRIGKDVIEILTSGMYVSPLAIYREYVQNAADAIDAARAEGLLGKGRRGTVTMTFDHAERAVTIRDNGAGIPGRDALSTLLAVGASPKRGTQARGFRGVGRLSGLAYCRELEFTSKAAGESETVCVAWDCHALRQRLHDSQFGGDLRRTVLDVVTVRREKAEDRDAHFFEVRLSGIARLRNDVLLNEPLIAQYLAQVAPVPFSADFTFAKTVAERLSPFVRHIPLALSVGDMAVERPFKDEMPIPASPYALRIRDVEFIEFADVDGGVGAAGWIAHHDYIRSIPGGMAVRGLRARSGDLQIGESNLFEQSFRESRFNGWTIGELHMLDPRITPNARRDDFEINHHYYNLLVQLGPLAARITQRCRAASISRNAFQTVKNTIEAVEGRLKQKRALDRAELSRLKSAVVKAQGVVRRVAGDEDRRALEAKLGRLEARLRKIRPRKGASVVALDETESLIFKHVTNKEQARTLIRQLRRRCA